MLGKGPGTWRSSRSLGADGMCGETASSSGYVMYGALGLFQGPEVLTGSEMGALTGEREEAVEGAAAQLILV